MIDASIARSGVQNGCPFRQRSRRTWTASLPARKPSGEPEGSRSANVARAAQFSLALALSLFLSPAALAQAPPPPDPWPGLVADIFQDRTIAEPDGVVALQAPARAEDAAIVPMTIKFDEPARRVRKVTLVIDQNPAPMAAAFTIGEHSGLTSIATRVRVNSYTNVHAVAETQDGALHAAVQFVKASGGCSAPAVKDIDEAMNNLGQMKYREFKAEEAGRREAQIMVRHPNNSGMQMDQLTHLYIPAHFIDKIVVKQGDELIFSMEGGISLSEDPNFRFTYAPNGAKTIRVEAHDSKGTVFTGEWPIADAS
ncbi:MAG: quinoprotein dehydrogenase-associated SoxYZ-like carrier [Methylocystis sp.]|nr:quinoprotein dehydrogenase-associated SoxYZ-like carrier [Methylocystis sp.]